MGFYSRGLVDYLKQKKKTETSHQLFLDACKSGQTSYIRELIEIDGINPNLTDSNGRSGLWYTVTSRKIGAIRLLVEHYGVKINGNSKESCPLFYSVNNPGYLGCAEISILLIQHGATVTSLSSIVRTSVKNENYEVLIYLINAGARSPRYLSSNTSAEIKELISNTRTIPKTLAEISRIKIRNTLSNQSIDSTPYFRKIDNLPLPTNLKKYLKLQNL